MKMTHLKIMNMVYSYAAAWSLQSAAPHASLSRADKMARAITAALVKMGADHARELAQLRATIAKQREKMEQVSGRRPRQPKAPRIQPPKGRD